MALPIDVTDPGNSNPETQAFGTGVRVEVNQGNVVATSWPASASAINVGVADSQVGRGLPANVNVG